MRSKVVDCARISTFVQPISELIFKSEVVARSDDYCSFPEHSFSVAGLFPKRRWSTFPSKYLTRVLFSPNVPCWNACTTFSTHLYWFFDRFLRIWKRYNSYKNHTVSHVSSAKAFFTWSLVRRASVKLIIRCYPECRWNSVRADQ